MSTDFGTEELGSFSPSYWDPFVPRLCVNGCRCILAYLLEEKQLHAVVLELIVVAK